VRSSAFRRQCLAIDAGHLPVDGSVSGSRRSSAVRRQSGVRGRHPPVDGSVSGRRRLSVFQRQSPAVGAGHLPLDDSVRRSSPVIHLSTHSHRSPPVLLMRPDFLNTLNHNFCTAASHSRSIFRVARSAYLRPVIRQCFRDSGNVIFIAFDAYMTRAHG
jgi:hypothetical protein